MACDILIAGVGNIFFADDAFGVEIVRVLESQRLPRNVTVKDFGIRAYDLAYAMTDGYDAVILVDVIQRGQPPGTISVLDLNQNIDVTSDDLSDQPTPILNGHSLDPYQVVQMVKRLGGRVPRLFLVGCEPATLESDEGRFGLSECVQASIPRAVEAINSLLSDLQQTEDKQPKGMKEVYAFEN